MKILLKYSALFTVLMAFFFVGCQEPITQPEELSSSSNQQYSLSKGGTSTYPLYAGQHILVGKIEVSNDANYIYVDYIISEDSEWCITETHLAVGASLADIPQTKKGNPQPGKFEFSNEHDCVTSYSYQIPNTWGCDGQIVIAAHAVVCKVVGFEESVEDFNATLPTSVSMSVVHHGGNSYFNTTVTGGGDLDGTYDGFCIDTDNNISPGATYTAAVISSYDPEFAESGLVEYPENMDLVNWVINQGFYGQPSTSGVPYTYGDIQRAIWQLIEDNPSTSGLGAWSQARADEIETAARENGEDFVPECGESVAVVLNPVSTDGTTNAQVTIAQVTFIDVNLECTPVYECETAWGNGGGEFPGNNWATFMNYTLDCGDTTPPSPPGCETAFAYGADDASCFLDITDEGSSFSRWGWTNGALSAGSYSFDIYAGAGQCDISKGTLVGTLSVEYDGSDATVTYTMNSGFTMNEIHLYVGNEILPRDGNGDFTVAPGQYPEVVEFDSPQTSYVTTVPASGDIYVVAHSVACGDFE